MEPIDPSQYAIELWEIICDKIDFRSKIRLRQVNRYLYYNLNIYDFYNIPDYYRKLLTNDILKQHLYITRLNAGIILTLRMLIVLQNLKVLNANNRSNINDAGISKITSLIRLYCRNTKY